ncbi:DNA-binding transcriptional regulator, AcrR family [Amycolatopsis pretoriensis]|uniref:DNA-binding transcriptional regulator, AcrR family n=1 Tax=Amycolatopsis pretoriensis TaxID=218821 RepID=A0A1H5R1S9_9PSEU|nr:TetR/AcrR family transcriptional regulator [Amycolatopsis pretoriensis]SEF32343.1 DNA-binding transcriptional regulator, AcrR family [Amycolatopsis pretoriensis]
MGARSDAKSKMVQAAKQLMRERGLHATAFSDVLKLSGAPRGSVYFHFPGGKTQLATEAAEAHAHEQVEIIDRAAAQANSAAELVERYVDLGRDGMVASGYSRGCAIAPLVTEGATQESAEIGETGRRTFSEMIDRLAFHFISFGVEHAAARALSDAVVAGVEGAMITSRARRSTAPYDALKAALVSYAATSSRSPRAAR